MSHNNGVFTEHELTNTLKEMKRDTAAGVDKIKTQDVKSIPIDHVTAIMNYWWSTNIPNTIKQCCTTLLPKKDDHREEVGSWRPVTVGNLLMRLYAKLLDKRLQFKIKLHERQKGFIPVEGCFKKSRFYNRLSSNKVNVVRK